jgi:hypothetical protein
MAFLGLKEFIMGRQFHEYGFRLFLLTLLLFAAGAVTTRAQDDLKIQRTTDMKFPGMDTSKAANNPLMIARVTTILVKGSRLRSDGDVPKYQFPNSIGKRRVSMIQQCDLKRTVRLFPGQKVYTIRNAGAETTKASDKKGGFQDVTIEVTDTGERKDMFGFVAKHLKYKLRSTPSADACAKMPMTIDGDGWYLELPTFACEIETDRTFDSMQETSKGCADEIRVQAGNTMHLGFALQETKTFSANGQSFQIIENVISLERANLDASLFEIPADYKATKNSPDDDAADTASTDSTNQNSANPDWKNRPLPEMAPTPSETTAQPKKPGIIRIGIVLPTTDLGDALEPMKPAGVIQNELLKDLKSETVEAVPVNSGVQTQQEAKQKECDYLFYSEAKKKFNAGKSPTAGMAASMATSLLSMMGPAGGIASTVVARMTMKDISTAVQNKDEITFSYRVDSLDGAAVIPQVTTSQKAKKQGDDIVTPQIYNAVAAVLRQLDQTKTK